MAAQVQFHAPYFALRKTLAETATFQPCYSSEIQGSRFGTRILLEWRSRLVRDSIVINQKSRALMRLCIQFTRITCPICSTKTQHLLPYRIVPLAMFGTNELENKKYSRGAQYYQITR